MKQQNILLILSFFLLFVGALVPDTVFADSHMLPITPLSQRFSPHDPNGDAGYHDCMPAALTIALNTLADEGMLSRRSTDLSYPSIRQYVRFGMPDPNRGIAPALLIEATGHITESTFGLSMTKVPSSSWEAFLRQEIEKKYPVIIHLSDRNSLFTSQSTTQYSHVVVVYGVDDSQVYYADPWDGMTYALDKASFAYAWGKGHYSWVAFQFEKKQFTSFRAILGSLRS